MFQKIVSSTASTTKCPTKRSLALGCRRRTQNLFGSAVSSFPSRQRGSEVCVLHYPPILWCNWYRVNTREASLSSQQPAQFVGIADRFLQIVVSKTRITYLYEGPASRRISIDRNIESVVERNFTAIEAIQCSASPNPQRSCAGQWSAEEAVSKALKVKYPDGGLAIDWHKWTWAPGWMAIFLAKRNLPLSTANVFFHDVQ